MFLINALLRELLVCRQCTASRASVPTCNARARGGGCLCGRERENNSFDVDSSSAVTQHNVQCSFRRQQEQHTLKGLGVVSTQRSTIWGLVIVTDNYRQRQCKCMCMNTFYTACMLQIYKASLASRGIGCFMKGLLSLTLRNCWLICVHRRRRFRCVRLNYTQDPS